jgi:anti-sigma factor RsiW
MPWPVERSRGPVGERRLRALSPCDAVSEELPLIVDGTQRPGPSVVEHLGTCLRCQAELAGYRRLMRALRALRDDPVALPSPDRIVSDTLRALHEHFATRRRRDPWVTAGAAAAVGVAIAMAALRSRLPWHPRLSPWYPRLPGRASAASSPAL